MANWIKSAIKRPGAFKAKAEHAGKSTREFAEEHKHDSGRTGSQARLAMTLMGMHGGEDHERKKLERRYGGRKG